MCRARHWSYYLWLLPQNHINKCTAVAVTTFSFKDSIENGSDAMKLGFVIVQQYNIADRLVTINTETNANGSRKVVC